jgi:hypothetical protein
VSRAAAALLALLLLAGCPLPQPLPDYPPGTITPPRILQETLWPTSGESLIFVPDNCGSTEEPEYTLEAKIYDANTIEQVEARWFVDYEPFDGSWTPEATPPVPPDLDPLVLTRTVPPFVFRPYNYPPRPGTGVPDLGRPYRAPGTLHVVELLVSNSFDTAPDATPRNRAATPNFETQLHRWTFLVASGLTQGCGQNVRPPPP